MACQELPGFYGSFCNITCPSGSYGVDCAGDCTPTCLYYQCHHVYGCMKNITDQITTISSDVSLLSRQHFTMLITDKPVKQTEFSKYLLFAVIGITFLIVIVLTMIHLLWKFNDRRKEKRKQGRHDCACNENGNLHLPLEPVYNDIDGF
ncbi:uncharacterized protein LOC111101462 isoform X2 [Crassostrea virginica]